MSRQIESLEARRMMSVGVLAGLKPSFQVLADPNYSNQQQLFVMCTSGNDRVSINTTTTGWGAKVGIRVNGIRREFSDINNVRLYGLGGSDTITLSGTNTPYTYSPVDIMAGAGNDKVIIGNYHGVVYAFGQEGNDTIDSSGERYEPDNRGIGERHLFGGPGNDFLIGGDNGEFLRGNDGNDIIFGGNGGDYLDGGNGNDLLFGGDGDDQLSGGTGRNVLHCGNGDDSVYVSPVNSLVNRPDEDGYSTGGHDIIFGGNGNDAIFRTYNSKMAWKPIFGDKTISVESETLTDYDPDGPG